MDKAGQKGTGRWTSLDALERGAVIPTLTEAVYARGVSSFKADRLKLAKLYKKKRSKPKLSKAQFTKKLEGALYAGMISCYAQGFELIRVAAKEQKWKINFTEIARIWEGGCIIRADLLNFLHRAFQKNKGKPIHLFAVLDIRKALMKDLPSLREVTGIASLHGVPISAFATTLSYFESMTSSTVSANFIQGLRDFFGAHTYERVDKKGVFHTPWSDLTL